jgi:hypothetical protein
LPSAAKKLCSDGRSILMETRFVIISYIATFGGIGVLVAAMFRRARVLAKRLPPEDRPWT